MTGVDVDVAVEGGGVAGPTSPAKKHRTTKGEWLVRVFFYGALVGIPILMTLPLVREAIGILAIVWVLVLLFMNVPVGISLALPSLWGFYVLNGIVAVEGTLATLPYHATASWTLTVIPMFVFMGLMLWRSGATGTLYALATRLLGWLPGGLAVGTNFAGAGLAAVSGETVGTTYALGRAGVPEMLKRGYDPRLATASVLMAGNMGQLIPPSIFMVIYAGVANVPVGPQLLAGLLPGVVLCLIYAVGIVTVSVLRPSLVGKGDGTSLMTNEADPRQPSLLVAFAKALPVMVLMVTVVVGIYTGVTTATEAAAVGSFGAMLIAVLSMSPRSSTKAVGKALLDTVTNTASIFLIIIGATILTRLIAVTGVARGLVDIIIGLGLGPVSLMLLLIVVYLFIGMFMSPLVMMLVTVPILLPVIDEVGISTLVFGVFVVLLCELAIVTPPVGMLLYIMHRIVQEKDVNLGVPISLSQIIQGALCSIPLSLLLLVLLVFFPEIAEWLPSRMSG
ncbi:MAG: TRAP transporter large permease subunit [Nocardioides sp.]|nr:TRAP transporter large permease subunit [Nocardioides sp.]